MIRVIESIRKTSGNAICKPGISAGPKAWKKEKTGVLSVGILLLAFLFIYTPLAAKNGYRITVRYRDGIENQLVKPGERVYLYLYRWGKKVPVDSARISSRGSVTFQGKKALEPGEYVTGNHPEFFVSGPAFVREDFTLVYPSGQQEYARFLLQPQIIHRAGSKENEYFTQLQNLVNYQWKQYDKEELQERLDDLAARARNETPGSLLDISLRNLTARNDPPKLAAGFPCGDDRLLNTNFAPKDIASYLQSIELNPADTIIKYTGRLIDCSHTPDRSQKSAAAVETAGLRSRIAAAVFDYFYRSPMMGHESVAVHTAEKYFLNKKLEWPDPEGLFLISSFVQLNKHSLLGMDAPELNLRDTSGNPVSLRGMPGEYTVLYFYTDDCAACKTETPELVDFINEYRDGVLNVYAVYTQPDSSRWKDYINREFVLYNSFVDWKNVYDPRFDSGFHLLYNVISTPQMFLLDKDKKIIGRNLKTDNLKKLLAAENKKRDDLQAFFGNFFSALAPAGGTAVRQGIDTFYNKSIRNPALFREIFRELYLFLKNQDSYDLQEGAAYLGGTYIADKPELWPDEGFVHRVARAVELFKMNPLGSTAAELILDTPDGSSLSLYDIKDRYKILYFYNFNCDICTLVSRELKDLYSQYRDRVEIIAVYTGKDYNNWIKYILDHNFAWQNVWDGNGTGEIYKKYHLQGVPVIYLLDDNHKIIAKDITPNTLRELLGRLFPPENKKLTP